MLQDLSQGSFSFVSGGYGVYDLGWLGVCRQVSDELHSSNCQKCLLYLKELGEQLFSTIFCRFHRNQPLFHVILKTTNPCLEDVWPKPIHVGGTYLYPQRAIYPSPAMGHPLSPKSNMQQLTFNTFLCLQLPDLFRCQSTRIDVELIKITLKLSC